MQFYFQAGLSASMLAFCFAMIAFYPGNETRVAMFWGAAQSTVTYWLPSPTQKKDENQ